MKPILRRRNSTSASGLMSPTDRPSTTTSPDVGRSSPPISDSKVVLPEPDRPRTATSCPRLDREVDIRSGMDDDRADREVAAEAARLDHGRPSPIVGGPSRSSPSPPVRRVDRAAAAVAVGAVRPTSSGHTLMWSSSSSRRTRFSSPSASTWARGNCNRPTRSRTAIFGLDMVIVVAGPDPVAQDLAADPTVPDGDGPADLAR